MEEGNERKEAENKEAFGYNPSIKIYREFVVLVWHPNIKLGAKYYFGIYCIFEEIRGHKSMNYKIRISVYCDDCLN